MRIIACGARVWRDPHLVRDWLNELADAMGPPLERITIVHGDNPHGLDRMMGALARRRGFEVEPHPADWARYGRHAAGPVRNREMLDSGADAVVGFKDGFDWEMEHGGTEDMIRIAMQAGVAWEVISHAGRRSQL